MILIILAIYGLLWCVYFARPGRRAGGMMFLATVLLPVALFGAAYWEAVREVERIKTESRESAFEYLQMGATDAEYLGKRVEVSRSSIGGIETVAYIYGGRYVLVFQNGKLVSKSRK